MLESFAIMDGVQVNIAYVFVAESSKIQDRVINERPSQVQSAKRSGWSLVQFGFMQAT